jgi:hypothetical protein
MRSCRSEKTVFNFFISLLLIGSHTPLYYIQITIFTIYFIINSLTPLSLTAMPWGRGKKAEKPDWILICQSRINYCYPDKIDIQ